jgi:uncharacterized protein (DUF433 family)
VLDEFGAIANDGEDKELRLSPSGILSDLAISKEAYTILVMSNKNLLSRITVDPEICHGKPCIRGLRYPVESILEYLAGGDTIESLLGEFPDLEREDILACHEFARKMLTAKSIHLPLT